MADDIMTQAEVADAPPETPESGSSTARRALRFGWLLALVLVLLQVGFFGLLIAAQAVPDDPIVDHLVDAVDDGLYGPTGRPDLMGGVAASHSECVMVGTGLGRPDLGIFERAVRLPRISSCATGDDDIRKLNRGQPLTTVTDYFRYWGGFTILTRPVLALGGMGAVRMVCGGMLAVAAALTAARVAWLTGTAYLAGMALPMLFASNILSTPSSSFGFALSYAAALLSVTFTAIGARRGIGHAVLGAVVGAAVFNYLTQLTTPAIPWMWSTAVAGAVIACRRGHWAPAARAVVAVGIAWPVSFTITWASRWLLAVIFVGWDEASTGIKDKIEFRLGGSSQAVRLELGASTEVNVGFWLRAYPVAWLVLVAAAVTCVAALAVASRRFGRRSLAVFGVLAAPALVTPVWYELLRNHSQIHVPFTYANLPAALGVVLAAALLVMRPLGELSTFTTEGYSSPLQHRSTMHSSIWVTLRLFVQPVERHGATQVSGSSREGSGPAGVEPGEDFAPAGVVGVRMPLGAVAARAATPADPKRRLLSHAGQIEVLP